MASTKITKHTRASKIYGKRIICPNCKYICTVYHFSWSALECGKCKKDIDKYDFHIQASKVL